MFVLCIRKVTSSNLDRNTQYPEISRGSSPFLWTNDPREDLRLSPTSSITRCCLCWLVSNGGTSMARIRNINSLACSIRQAKASSAICSGAESVFIEESANFLRFRLCEPWRGFLIVKTGDLQPKFPHIPFENPNQKSVYSTWHCHRQLFGAFPMQFSCV
jgi:hypothetical protein